LLRVSCSLACRELAAEKYTNGYDTKAPPVWIDIEGATDEVFDMLGELIIACVIRIDRDFVTSAAVSHASAHRRRLLGHRWVSVHGLLLDSIQLAFRCSSALEKS
jgi:hypothetical protein